MGTAKMENTIRYHIVINFQMSKFDLHFFVRNNKSRTEKNVLSAPVRDQSVCEIV